MAVYSRRMLFDSKKEYLPSEMVKINIFASNRAEKNRPVDPSISPIIRRGNRISFSPSAYARFLENSRLKKANAVAAGPSFRLIDAPGPSGAGIFSKKEFLLNSAASNSAFNRFGRPSLTPSLGADSRFAGMISSKKRRAEAGENIETFFEISGSLIGLFGVPFASFAGRRIGAMLNSTYVSSLSKIQKALDLSALFSRPAEGSASLPLSPVSSSAASSVKKEIASFPASAVRRVPSGASLWRPPSELSLQRLNEASAKIALLASKKRSVR